MTLFEEALMTLDEVRRKLDTGHGRDAAIDEMLLQAIKLLESDWAAMQWELLTLSLLDINKPDGCECCGRPCIGSRCSEHQED